MSIVLTEKPVKMAVQELAAGKFKILEPKISAIPRKIKERIPILPYEAVRVAVDKTAYHF